MGYFLGLLSFSLITTFMNLPSLYASPVAFLNKTDRHLQKLTQAVLETDDGYLYRLPDAKDEDFQNLYWVDLSDSLYDRLSLETLGKVITMSEGRFAVLEIAPESVPLVSGSLHNERTSCGHLLKLNGDETPLERLVKVAVPIQPINQPLASLKNLHAQISADSIRGLVEEMSALPSRYAKANTASETTNLLVNRYTQSLRPDITVTTFPHKNSPMQPSVIVRIEGTTRSDEVVVLGSHIDSIAIFSASAPGADDNASGTAAHYEVFRTILENNLKFERTVEIHGYAAEELGLIGSQDIAKKYVANGVEVVAMLQNDMNLFREGNEDVIWLITNDTDKKLTSDVAQLVKQYQTITVHQGFLLAGSSDHRAWSRHGIPTVFPTENPNAFNQTIHSSRDTIANSGHFTQSAEFAKLSLSFLAHFAGLVED